MISTGSCVDVVWFVQIRPGWPGSKPSVGETWRRGYGKPSAVVKTRVEALLVVGCGARESEVSGPESVKGEERVRVSV